MSMFSATPESRPGAARRCDDKEQPGVDILPIAVEDAAGQNQERGTTGDRLDDQRLQGLAPAAVNRWARPSSFVRSPASGLSM